MHYRTRKPPKRYFDHVNNRIIHKAHHVEWHTNRNVFDKNCGWCQEEVTTTN